jgi:hypothetical protein
MIDPIFGKLFEAIEGFKLCEVQKEPLVGVTVVADDSTGLYDIGELDFAIHGNCRDWLNQDESNKVRLVEFLRKLADDIEKGKFS